MIVTGVVEREEGGGSLWCSVIWVCPERGVIGKRRKVSPYGSFPVESLPRVEREIIVTFHIKADAHGRGKADLVTRYFPRHHPDHDPAPLPSDPGQDKRNDLLGKLHASPSHALVHPGGPGLLRPNGRREGTVGEHDEACRVGGKMFRA
jgi:hypothetical protein